MAQTYLSSYSQSSGPKSIIETLYVKRTLYPIIDERFENTNFEELAEKKKFSLFDSSVILPYLGLINNDDDLISHRLSFSIWKYSFRPRLTLPLFPNLKVLE